MTRDTSAYEADVSCRKRTPVEQIAQMYIHRCWLNAYVETTFLESTVS